jgi:hypothetical protein
MLVRFRIAAAAHDHIAPARNGYNLLLPRAALFTLLVVSILDGSLQAQRTGATFQGNAGGLPVRSGFVGQRGFPNRFFPRRGFFPSRFHLRHDSFGSIFVPYSVPYGEPVGYEQPDAEPVTNGPVPPVVILRTPEPPVPKAQVIEIPGVANSTAAKVLPPTIFILTNGERLETRRFVLTASLLSVSIDRQQRTVPLDMLDINATITTNHERGIDLRIPDDRNEISLSF